MDNWGMAPAFCSGLEIREGKAECMEKLYPAGEESHYSASHRDGLTLHVNQIYPLYRILDIMIDKRRVVKQTGASGNGIHTGNCNLRRCCIERRDNRQNPFSPKNPRAIL